MRGRNTLHQLIRTAVNVNVTPSGIDIAIAVMTGFQTTQPQNAAQNPIPLRIGGSQLRTINFPSRSPPAKHAVDGRTGADFGANARPAGRRTLAAFALSGTVFGRGNGIPLQLAAVIQHPQLLGSDVYIQL